MFQSWWDFGSLFGATSASASLFLWFIVVIAIAVGGQLDGRAACDGTCGARESRGRMGAWRDGMSSGRR